jgi:S1-C subfamily serine protease
VGKGWSARARWVGRSVVVTGLITGMLGGWATPTLSSSADVNPVRPDQLELNIRAATVELMTLGCDLGTRQGSAVALAGGSLVTNRHVVDLSRETEVVPDLGAVARGTADISSTGSDLAIVHARTSGLKPLPLAPDDPRPGTLVTLAGFQAGTDGIDLRQAHVVDYVDGAPRGQPVPVMRLDALIGPGMSGGPVVDAAGRLTGIIFGSESPSQYAVALPVSAVRALLSGTPVTRAGSC